MATLDEIFQRTFGLTDAEMAESTERNRARAADRAEALRARRSPWIGRIPINPTSTMTHALQGTGRFNRLPIPSPLRGRCL